MPSDVSGSPVLPRHQILPVSSKASRTRLEEGMNPARQAPPSSPRARRPSGLKRWPAICPSGWRGGHGRSAGHPRIGA